MLLQMPSILVAEQGGLRALAFDPERPAAPHATAGDDPAPNNLMALDESNAFAATVLCTLGASVPGPRGAPFGRSSTPRTKKVCSILPDRISLTVLVSKAHLIFELRV
jgi:hypothetical protein